MIYKALARRSIAVALLSLMASLAACGGASSASTGTNTSGGSAGGSATASSVRLSGTITGVLKNAANCAKESDQNTIVITDTINGKLYLFQIVATHYHGAGTYTTGTTEGEPVVNITDEASGGDWVSQYSDTPGTIVVNTGETAGTINVTLVNQSDKTNVTASGAWACA